MKAIIKFITNPLLISIIGLIAIAVVIWFGGPMLAINESKPLESEMSRLITILVITVLWGLNNFRIQNKQKKKDSQLMGEIAQSAPLGKAEDSRSAEESKVLQQQFGDALNILKASKKHADQSNISIHELPWYIIIGPPGSGKTTALINSGLRFPLAEKMGQQPLKGIGGTRNCDWWFSDDAILVDTAGRYTTQDSDKETDSAGWSNFLGLLKKHRPRQPINGAIIAISLTELIMQSESERQQHANQIKERLQELYDNLGIQFPVYVLLTKTDLVAGFNEYFDNLSRQERHQAWGMTFPTSGGFESNFDINYFKDEYDALLRRLNDRLQWRMQEERDLSRRALILGFPTELASLKEMTAQFLDTAFKPSNFSKTVNLRGIFFTSGTQEGTPIDRVMGALASNFGLNRQTIPAYSGQGKSFFLTDLFRNVIFPESALAGTNRSHEQKQNLMRKGSYAFALIATIASAGLWTSQYAEIKAQIDEMDKHVELFIAESNSIPENNIEPEFLLASLTSLQQAQNSATDDARGVFSQAGLSQMRSLGPASDEAYYRTLQLQYLPSLVTVLENKLTDPNTSLDDIFITLKTYLMLADRKRFNKDKESVTNWYIKNWEEKFPGNTAKQAQLQHHLKTLFEIGFDPIATNERIVSTSRFELRKIPLAKRIYTSLKQQGDNTLNDFFLSSVLDSSEQQIFLNKRDEEEPIVGIPGLYTKVGYESLFLEQSVKLSQESTKDDWIFGDTDKKDDGKIDPDQIHADVEALYIKDFIKHWTGMFQGIKLSKFKNLEHSTEVLENLGNNNSSLMRVVETLNINTDLRNKPNLLQQVGADKLKKLGKVGKKAAKKVKSDIPMTPVGKKLRNHFKTLIALSEAVEGKPPELQRYMQSIIKLHDYMNEVFVAADPNVAALEASMLRMKTNGKDIVGKLRRDAKKLPSPVNQWVKSLTTSSWRVLLTASRQEINDRWDNQLLESYNQSIKNRYPIYKTRSQQTSFEDFSEFFAPEGTYNTFLIKNIMPFVKEDARRFNIKTLEGQSIGFTKGALVQLRRGKNISRAFFGKNAENISVKFRLTPKTLDAKVKRFTLRLDEDNVSYRHGPTRSSSHTWPFTDDAASSKIILRFEKSGSKVDQTYKGTWSFFKLLEKSNVKSTSSADKFNLTFSKDGYFAKYDLKANSVTNPFNLRELQAFRAPSKL